MTASTNAGDTWTGDNTYYYRYYTATTGQAHLLELALSPQAYATAIVQFGGSLAERQRHPA